MKLLLTTLLLLACVSLNAQKATIKLTNGQYINNAPSDRDWSGFSVAGVSVYDGSDTLFISNLSDSLNVKYYGNWARGKTGVGCECSFSNTANDSLVLYFTDAKSFIWYGELMAHHGIVDAYLNNVYLGEIDTYDPRNLRTTRNWERHDLDPLKVYKFKLVVSGRKNPLSTGYYFVNHAFKMWKDAPPVVVPPPVEPPADATVVVPPPIVQYNYTIIRSGRFQVALNGVILEGEHNEYEKAIERAILVKSQNPLSTVTIISPVRTILIK